MKILHPVGRLTPILLRLMHDCGFVKYSDKPIVLKSGKQSRVYVFGRDDLTDNPTLLHLLGREVVHAARLAAGNDAREPCLIGLPTAGTPLAQAASMINFFEPEVGKGERPRLLFRIMREKLKTGYGVHNSWVNGAPDTKNHIYCVVDNVITTGASKIETAEHLLEDGYPAREMPWLILVDRGHGAIDDLKSHGFKNIVVIFTLRDIITGFGRHCFWTPEMTKAALSEFK